jgi:hypothetical protein
MVCHRLKKGAEKVETAGIAKDPGLRSRSYATDLSWGYKAHANPNDEVIDFFSNV